MDRQFLEAAGQAGRAASVPAAAAKKSLKTAPFWGANSAWTAIAGAATAYFFAEFTMTV
jgi:hypothetical protein